MRPALLASLLVCTGLSACVTAQELGVMDARATAELRNGQGASVGTANLAQGQYGVLIRLETAGLAPGWHGLHIHEHGTCAGPGFQSAGPHVRGEAPPPQPGDPPVRPVTHGFLSEGGGEWGDLPNLYVHADGTGRAEFIVPFGFLMGDRDEVKGLLDADGSALVIHAREDDHRTQPIGGSGDRVACGVIQAAR